jgi:tRNA U34 5-methylaminomethyl-2-thiouridine-forming methyltransferase MnmC
MKKITTEDGSFTLKSKYKDECYHSVKGAMTESMHIYIQCGLLDRVQRLNDKKPTAPINVLEIGFGTGLNAFLALVEAHKKVLPIHYTSLELYPLTLEEAQMLNYDEWVDARYHAVYQDLLSSSWNQPVALNATFTLEKIEADVLTYDYPSAVYDVVFFDAFSPESQPELWTEKFFQKLYDAMNFGGIFVTYCAKGVVRRSLQNIGFVVERLPGPPNGKREILRATKNKL